MIQRQLGQREREVLTLVKRCASQEEKMREYSKLSAQNRDSSNSLEDMRSQLENIAQEKENLASLWKQLQESELMREDLLDQLAKVKREYDAVTDTLQECLGNIKLLTNEKE